MLQDFQRARYAQWHRAAVMRAVGRIFARSSPQRQEQAAEEVLALSHVIFHETSWHHLPRNLKLLRAYEPLVREACERYEVPLPMALGILAWENGGRVDGTSWAACSGLGQLSLGAVQRAHAYHATLGTDTQAAGTLLDALDVACTTLRRSTWGWDLAWGRVMGRVRRVLLERSVAQRHRREAARLNLADERLSPACNIEDSVLFMRFLLDALEHRVDLAVAAYHNGVANMDDLTRAYVRKHRLPLPSARGRLVWVEALRRYGLDYMAFWQDSLCRQMLNGTRTMDGEQTTAANASQAMGDEADIYVFKVAGAYAAYQMGPAQVAELLSRYKGALEDAALDGCPRCSLRAVAPGVSVAAEVEAYLRSLTRRYRGRTGHVPTFKLVIRHATSSHACGLAVDLATKDQSLLALLREDWLMDRIYWDRLSPTCVHLCINPRFASWFLDQGNMPTLGPARLRMRGRPTHQLLQKT